MYAHVHVHLKYMYMKLAVGLFENVALSTFSNIHNLETGRYNRLHVTLLGLTFFEVVDVELIGPPDTDTAIVLDEGSRLGGSLSLSKPAKHSQTVIKRYHSRALLSHGTFSLYRWQFTAVVAVRGSAQLVQ